MNELKKLMGREAELVLLHSSSPCFNVQLVECFRNNILLVALVGNVAGWSRINVGQLFQVRIKDHNVFFSYHAQITRLCNNEHLCLQVNMPGIRHSDIQGQEPRIRVDKKEIKITLQDGKQKIPVSVEDISVSGAKLVSNIRLGNVNDELNIELSLISGERSLRLPCKIRYVSTELSLVIGDNEKFYHGVEFQQLADNVENFLYRFVG